MGDMKEELQSHYEQIQKAIQGNISTIQTLINQAASLQAVIESISEGVDGDKKIQLQEEVGRINSSISTLIKNTETLFALYNEFVKAIVRSK